MSSCTVRPKLTVIVGNAITGDSRVQKTALAAARDGWDVTLVGRAPKSKIEHSWLGPVKVIRVPVSHQLRKHLRPRPRPDLRRKITRLGLRTDKPLALYRAQHKAWVRGQTTRIGWTYDAADQADGAGGAIVTTARRLLIRAPLRARVRLGQKVYRYRVRAYRWGRRGGPPAPRATGDWRKDHPELQDLDLAFGKVIEEIGPDVIHANDITMIGVAARSAARLRARGRRCAWLYDAHEYVRGVDWRPALMGQAFVCLEDEFIRHADAVVTVSPEIAETLQRDHGLITTPLVVRNTPIRQAVGTKANRVSVREAAGLGPEVPLLVYSGWLDRERGVDTAVEGLSELPGVHLALVSGRSTSLLEEILARASDLGVRDRVHVVPYVPQAEVADYLSAADVGLICSRRSPNYEMSLPTKLAEYLHAALPVVASDVRTLREYVEKHMIGEVFVSGDHGSFANAVRRALARRRELTDRITEPMLKELSWEHQCAGLLRLYRKVTGLTPPGRRPGVPWDATERKDWAPKSSIPTTDWPEPSWTPLGDTPIRLGLGPANYAGQLASFAQALSLARPDVSMEVVMNVSPGSFHYPADVHLDRATLGRLDVPLEQIRRVVGSYTHLIADAFLSVLGSLNGGHIEDDLPALRRFGLKVALLGHGSEVRHPGRHVDRYEFSLFRDAPDGMVDRLTAIAERNHRVATESGLPLFVTTPDLLEDLPKAIWAPLVVDVDAWSCDRPVMERPRPIVLHAPSARWTKGTDRILPVLEDLHERGFIDFRLAEKVPWAQMRQLVREADAVVDQFAIGTYGTFACEAMAAGKPVIAYLSESVQHRIRNCPVINATPASLGTALTQLLDDRAAAARTGAECTQYVRALHDGAATARALNGFLL